MSLTGTAFFYVLIAATVLAMVATLFAWGAVRGPRPVRWLTRVVMIAICQITAIAVVAAWINNSYGLYTDWNDLLGRDNGTQMAAMPGPPPGRAMFTRSGNGLLETYVHGEHSKLSGQVLVWTPPQYDERQNRTKSFPVIMLLHGIPGSPLSWVEGLNMPGMIAKLMASGQVKPAVVVIPVIDPGGVDTDCSDTPTRKNATWLAKDVPELIRSQFRVLPEAKAWGMLGYSTGGLCSVKLAMQYPASFAVAAAMSPDSFAGDSAVLKDPVLRKANSPLALADKWPRVWIFLATAAKDHSSPPSNLTALQRVAIPPTLVAEPLVLATGGHSPNTWVRLLPTELHWMSDNLDPARVLAPPKKPAPKPQPKHPLPSPKHSAGPAH
ncbi:alpha/beta hydrolase [Streptacidiphilus carbonis]|uniref:alpha/beta hydrolase n=1 Tax=Streptacidiphilus carbonis TaxID=105422 RepID=UPI0007C7279B|nr:alpha/beta hydrolase-fold protein [Streptacidiphilus carbonis]